MLREAPTAFARIRAKSRTVLYQPYAMLHLPTTGGALGEAAVSASDAREPSLDRASERAPISPL